MGWNARLNSGIVVRQSDGVKFSDVNIHAIEEMWIDDLENIRIHRQYCPGFVEFVQYEVACVTQRGPEKVAEFIGWTNGDVEFVFGITREKHNFHPQSVLK